MEDHLIDTQVKSLAIAFVVVSIMLGLLLRSVRLVGLSMLPNLLPVLIGVALMPLLGIGLNPGTVRVALT
jgi:hypothetical protein